MKSAELLLTPDANLDVEHLLDIGQVRFRVREVIGIKSEGTPETKLTDSVEFWKQGHTTRIASSKSNPDGKHGQGSCDPAYLARSLPQYRQNMKSGTTWTTTGQTSRVGAT